MRNVDGNILLHIGGEYGVRNGRPNDCKFATCMTINRIEHIKPTIPKKEDIKKTPYRKILNEPVND